MKLLANLDHLYDECKRNQWLRYFAVFCRVALALGFIPSGIVKVMGERFTALPSNHPLGHFFDALYLTGFYYTFIGVSQLTAALLLLIPRTALLGAIIYFPIILNICVLTYATRFEGTRIATLMLLANVFLLCWDYAVEIRSASCIIEQCRQHAQAEHVSQGSLRVFRVRSRSRRFSDRHQHICVRHPPGQF